MLIKALVPKLTLVLSGFFVGMQLHPTVFGPTEREIIEILAEYDVRHIDAPPGVPYYGSTDMEKRVIWIVNNQDHTFKLMTTIRELTHVAKRMRLDEDQSEESVRVIEEAEYKRIFVDGR